MHQISWEDAPRPCRDDHVTKSWNRKLIRVTSSNEGLKHISVDLSDYNRYLNQIWYRTQIPHYQHAGIYMNWKSKMAAVAILNVGKMSITLDWINISCIKLYGKMHHGDAEMTTWPKVETGSKFAWRHQMNVWSIFASISVTITVIWTKFGTQHKSHNINMFAGMEKFI